MIPIFQKYSSSKVVIKTQELILTLTSRSEWKAQRQLVYRVGMQTFMIPNMWNGLLFQKHGTIRPTFKLLWSSESVKQKIGTDFTNHFKTK